VVVDGMGHDLPEPVWRPMVDAVVENFAAADEAPDPRAGVPMQLDRSSGIAAGSLT